MDLLEDLEKEVREPEFEGLFKFKATDELQCRGCGQRKTLHSLLPYLILNSAKGVTE